MAKVKEEKVLDQLTYYTEDEKNYRAQLIQKLEYAARQRDNKWTEFDDSDYLTYYEDNSKAANAYIRPKLNKEDSRIVTGTTQEKERTLVSTILNYNLEPEFTAFNSQDIEEEEIGQIGSDLVKKSREIEMYDKKRPLIYKEAFDQGTAFAEEIWYEETKIDKVLKDFDFSDGVNVGKIKWEKETRKTLGECRVNLIPGTKVYLGNIREFFIENQPFVFIYDTMDYNRAKAIYGEWNRWQYVPKKVKKLRGDDPSIPYRDWTLLETEGDMVEIIKFQDKWMNELMIMINGVMMLPIEFPLTAVSPSGEYTLGKLDINPISQFFAYSKSIPTDTKIDQAVLDEMIRLVVLKTRKSFEPPMINNTNRVLSRSIYLPGKITAGINPTQLGRLDPEGSVGVTAPEINAFQMIKDIVNEKSLNAVWSGDQTRKDMTATEIQELKKQQLMKLGWAVLGIVLFEQHIAILRIHNILFNWTKKIDERVDDLNNRLVNVYRTINLESTGDEGNISKMIEFSPEGVNRTPEQIMAEEDILSNSTKQVRKFYLDPTNPELFKLKWYCVVTPTEKNTSELDATLFSARIREGQALFGPQTINYPYVQKRWAIKIKEDPNKFFVNQQITPMMEGGEMMGEGMSDQLAQGVSMPKNPSINTLMNQ